LQFSAIEAAKSKWPETGLVPTPNKKAVKSKQDKQPNFVLKTYKNGFLYNFEVLEHVIKCCGSNSCINVNIKSRKIPNSTKRHKYEICPLFIKMFLLTTQK